MTLLFEIGAFRVMCKHIQLKDNTWYYRRRVPEDARSLHKDSRTGKPKPQLFFSLKTTDKAEAARLANSHTRRLDALWKAHRQGHGNDANPKVSIAMLEAYGLKPGDAKRFPDHDVISDFVDSLVAPYEPDDEPPHVSPQDHLTIEILRGAPIPRTLTDAREKHFELGKGPKNKVGEQQFDRAWNLLLEITGDMPLDGLRREHANEFVRRLVATGVGAETIKRYLSQVRPVINTGIREFELQATNPFVEVTIPNRDEGPRKPRDVYTMPQLDAIQQRCREVDDQRRWAIAMISDTMARLAEVAGLRKEDVILDDPIPHMKLRSTEERRLKTKQSERLVPLVGEALWAAQRAMSTPGDFLFPVLHPKDAAKPFNANSASSALNKWLKENKLAKDGQGLHSFRHTMRDRLRDVLAPADLIDRIGGWKRLGVGEGYGKGHSLEMMHTYMLKVVRPARQSSQEVASTQAA
ncbi:DUF6538 domain-containing protein [Defluviimonas sp. D31]|uniref:DUF6538 domain-containing protein n=1 Tax=Defluviimonas sp. D31 TaxID=3083253 RepID=UPI00296F3AC1|nr:DUF6538 domain-containing protein [Defluviimonas sp. D31]